MHDDDEDEDGNHHQQQIRMKGEQATAVCESCDFLGWHTHTHTESAYTDDDDEC